jgi:hypothetical protein
VTLFEITHAQRVGWQRRAARELAAILDAHRDLPSITWTVGAAGCALVGHISGLAPAAEVRAAFELWRVALMLTERSEASCGGGRTSLRAAADRHRVRVRLTATVVDDQDEAVGS